MPVSTVPKAFSFDVVFLRLYVVTTSSRPPQNCYWQYLVRRLYLHCSWLASVAGRLLPIAASVVALLYRFSSTSKSSDNKFDADQCYWSYFVSLHCHICIIISPIILNKRGTSLSRTLFLVLNHFVTVSILFMAPFGFWSKILANELGLLERPYPALDIIKS